MIMFRRDRPALVRCGRETFPRRTLGGSSVAGFNEDFAYDPIGNRVSSTDYDETGAARTSLYTANSLNQYTSRTVPGWASVRGLADADATVTVNSNLAYALASGDLAYFFGSDDFDNSNSGGFAELEVSAVVSDGTNDLVSVATNRVFVPPANETYAYDADGNQTLVTTGTGAWQVEYNGENRPVRWICGDKTILMTFDHQGRRRLYVEVAAGVTNKLHRFTYNDYVCIARNREIDAQHGVGSDAFVWDPTEPMATRPLMCNQSTAPPFLYCHDGNKNVSEAVTPDGTIAAHYEYSSFGKVVMVVSENEDQSSANLNPYRFSSEYVDDTLGLTCYNYRCYNPMDGRWIGRDIIGDIQQHALYAYCRNTPMSIVDFVGACVIIPDPLGMIDSDIWNILISPNDLSDGLPDCPLKIDVCDFEGYPPMPKCPNGWASVGPSRHVGGTWELRSNPSKRGTGQQCVYDVNGNLITEGPSAGTPDRFSPIKHPILHYLDGAWFFVGDYIDNVIMFYSGQVTDFATKFDHYFSPPNKGASK